MGLAQIGQFVENEEDGRIGRISQVHFAAYSVQIGEGGYERETWDVDKTTLSTEEAYNEQLARDATRLQQARVAARHHQNNSVRWLCLECGATYNGNSCPKCDGTDRIENTGRNETMSGTKQCQEPHG
ncbi:hypothetical protein [Dictyobacter arantiisoli]|uniref:Uncharacterized protein n=1 Tax=Dictyobacter arantiisoli TaxID=2014874 RepID=A0A5A5TJ42_9CHLR|nr:hypothetical protein [Dictyobacter arantiisoli]GCF11245.1 hypothetical protein KDI_48090 [Dictyobacter arantiisoli]